MCWMYILRNDLTDRYYIGSTKNLKLRIRQHERGSTRTTKVLKILNLVYAEEFSSVEDARVREKKLKSYKSKKYLKWLISKSVSNKSGMIKPA